MNHDIIFKKSPDFEYLKLDIDGNPALLDNTVELSCQFGESDLAIGCMLIWEFKVYDTLSGNKLITDCKISHRYLFKKFSGLTLEEVNQVVSESYKECKLMLEIKLLENEVRYAASEISSDYLQGNSQGIFDELQKNLYL